MVAPNKCDNISCELAAANVGGNCVLASAKEMRQALAIDSHAYPGAAAVELRQQVEAWVNEGGSWERGDGMLRVLVIEDEVIIGMLLAQILTGMGHEVISVEGTEEGAVSAAARDRPGLIVVDQSLRAGSGHGAIERILRHGFIPHVWTSGGGHSGTNRAAGVAELRKPFTEQALGMAIAQVCGRTSPVAPAD